MIGNQRIRWSASAAHGGRHRRARRRGRHGGRRALLHLTARHGRQHGCAELWDRAVELSAYFETGFDLPFELSEEFTRQFPNVTWDISQDQFTNLMNATPRLLSGDNPPDLIRLPSMVSWSPTAC